MKPVAPVRAIVKSMETGWITDVTSLPANGNHTANAHPLMHCCGRLVDYSVVSIPIGSNRLKTMVGLNGLFIFQGGK
jgi:hypothetical protein